MLMLPKNVGALAIAASKEPHRFALGAVRVEEFQGDVYRLTATDGRLLAVVRGKGNDQSPHPGMLEAGNDIWDYLVPASAWQKFFASAKKGEAVGIAADKEDQAVAMTRQGTTQTEPLVQGRFPNVNTVLPSTPAILGVKLQPDLLIRALTIAQAILGDDPVIWLLHWGEGKPLGISGRTADGQSLDILLMPLNLRGDEWTPAAEGDPGEDSGDGSDDGGGKRPNPPPHIDNTDPAATVERQLENGYSSNGYHQPPLPEAVEVPVETLPEPVRVVRPKRGKRKGK